MFTHSNDETTVKNPMLLLLFTKSIKRDNIYKLCLWIIVEHNLPSINVLACSKAEI